MERLFEADVLNPGLIFSGLRGEIIDYVISSYMVNMSIIRLYYWHPAIQIHCNRCYQAIRDDIKYVHIHELTDPGIYHAKFILITTTEMLRFIVTTANMTNQMIQNCRNDYYIVEIPRCTLSSNTLFLQNLQLFFTTYDIKLKSPLQMYDWKGLNAKLLISIPKVIDHRDCFLQINKKYLKIKHKGKGIIMSSSGMLGFNIKPLLKLQTCTFQYVENHKLREDMNWLLYDLEHNINNKTNKPNYELETVETKPFHFKRYDLWYDKDNKHIMIITSANLTKQAWGSQKSHCDNAELGIVWNFKL